MQTLKETKKFNSNREFLEHLYAALENDKVCNFIESYDKQTEVHDYEPSEEADVDFNVYFLNEDFTIQDIAIKLLQKYSSDVCMKIDNDMTSRSETPIEFEDGTKIYQKSLEAFLFPECEYCFTY